MNPFVIIGIFLVGAIIFFIIRNKITPKYNTNPTPSTPTEVPGSTKSDFQDHLIFIHDRLFKKTNPDIYESTVGLETVTSLSYVIAKVATDMTEGAAVIRVGDIAPQQLYDIGYNLRQLINCNSEFAGDYLTTDDGKQANMAAVTAVEIIKTMRSYDLYIPLDVMSNCKRSENLIYRNLNSI